MLRNYSVFNGYTSWTMRSVFSFFIFIYMSCHVVLTKIL